MNRIVVAVLVAAAAVACGSASSSVDPTSVDPLVASGACTKDADCEPGEVCRTVRIGEFEQSSCARPTVMHGDDVAEAGAGAEAASDAAKTDALVADAGPPPPPFDAGPVDANATCTRALTVDITQYGPALTCTANSYYNTTVETSSPALLTYPCIGTGPATVTFGAQTFTGNVVGGAVRITNVDTYPFKIPSTGTTCNYRSVQTISGYLTSSKWSYTYTEALAPKQSPICALLSAACDASGPVSAPL